jgi:hypothetical protein
MPLTPFNSSERTQIFTNVCTAATIDKLVGYIYTRITGKADAMLTFGKTHNLMKYLAPWNKVFGKLIIFCFFPPYSTIASMHPCMITDKCNLIPVNNQLDAKLFFLICLFQFSTCFEQHRAHHQENQLYQYNIWYTSLYVGDRLVCKSGISCLTCTLDGLVFHTRRSSLAY